MGNDKVGSGSVEELKKAPSTSLGLTTQTEVCDVLNGISVLAGSRFFCELCVFWNVKNHARA